MSADFAIYRLPFAHDCILMEQDSASEPLQLNSPEELAGVEGFVFAPFQISDDCPLLVLQGKKKKVPLSSSIEGMISSGFDTFVDSCHDSAKRASTMALAAPRIPRSECPRTDSDEERRRYHHDFQLFHGQLQRGKFEKLVLARHTFTFVDSCHDSAKRASTMALAAPRITFVESCRDSAKRASTMALAAPRIWENKVQPDPLSLFYTACRLYPRMFIALVRMAACGTWLMATPEILLEGEKDCWHTVALAGTMKAGEKEGWSEKNLREQEVVAKYVRERVLAAAEPLPTEEGPFTVGAGDLLHLRSDFKFRLKEGVDYGHLVAALHPTPAVCGLPRDEARRFIVANESGDRRYYSGFCGPITEDGIHLFVSLRCMEIRADGNVFHAGGGLLCDSDEQQEWEETETKMDTMRRVLDEVMGGKAFAYR